MTILQAIILGIVQGLTEFLPISSSGHLVIVPLLLQWKIPEAQVFPFDVLVQLGTLGAVIVYFWKDVWQIIRAFVLGLLQRKPFADPQARMGWYLILATIPAGAAGVLIKSKVEAAFNSPLATGAFLLLTALILFAAEKIGKRTRSLESFNWKDALWIGVAQIISLFPGVSRSGSTIAGGMIRDLDRTSAARFSFLMSIPVMLGAGLVSILDLKDMPGLNGFLPTLAIGFVTAAVVGYLSIRWLLAFLTRRPLTVFIAYVAVVGVLTIAVALLRPAAAPAVGAASSDALPVTVQLSPSLEWIRPTLNTCAQQSNLALWVDEAPTGASDQVVLRWGEPENLVGKAYQLGADDWKLVVNPENSLQSISLERLQQIYSAFQVPTWLEAAQDCSECSFKQSLPGFADQTVDRWTTPAGSDLAEVAATIANLQPANSVNTASSPLMLRDEIAKNPAALGFLPARFIDESLRILPISGLNQESTRQPILAIVAAEPNPALQSWLACLQRTLS